MLGRDATAPTITYLMRRGRRIRLVDSQARAVSASYREQPFNGDNRVNI